MIACGIDAGSNSIRMLIARVEDGKIAEELHSERHITRLSAGIGATGRLSPEGAEKTLQLFSLFHAPIQQYKVNYVFAAATSAVREASDSAAFIAKAREAGIELHIISGDDEARYTFMGVTAALDRDVSNSVIYDIGGGSTEVSLILGGERVFSRSVPVGVVKLSDKFGFSGVFTEGMRRSCAAYVRGEFAPVLDTIRSMNGNTKKTAIGTAGTVTTIAAYDLRLESYDRSRINGHILSAERLRGHVTDMLGMTPEDVLALPGIEKGREDLVIPGTILIGEILAGLGMTETVVSDSGLREGLVIAASTIGSWI